MNRSSFFLFVLSFAFSLSVRSQVTSATLNIAQTASCQNELMSVQMSAAASISAVEWFKDGQLIYTSTAVSLPNGAILAGGNGQGGQLSQLRYPYDAVQDPLGNTYVMDRNNNRIMKWEPGASEGIIYAGLNGSGPGLDQFRNAYGLAIDANGSIYIADRNNHRVLRWDQGASQGVVVAGGNGIGNGLHQFYQPEGLTVDALGRVYVADKKNQRVMRWDVGATQGVVVAGGNGGGSSNDKFQQPVSVAVDAAFNIFVLDRKNARVMKWAPGATSGVLVAGGNGTGTNLNQLSEPKDIEIDAAGNLYIIERNNHRVSLWTPGATEGVIVAGGNGNGAQSNQLSFPSGLYRNAQGAIVIADHANHRIVQWDASSPSLQLTSNGSGIYSAKVILEGGAELFTNTVNFVLNPLPTTGFTYTQSFNDFQFTETSTYGASFLWNFGDGTTASSASPTHSYSSEGTYFVCLDVLDACGNLSSNCQSIDVTFPAPPPVVVDIVLAQSMDCKETNISVQGFLAEELDSVELFKDLQWIGTYKASAASNGVQIAGSTGQGGQLNQLRFPQEVEVYNGSAYVVDRGNNRVVRWDANASQGVVVAGGNGSGTGLHQLRDPRGIAIDNNGNVFVSDRNNNRIVKWAPGASQGVLVAGGNGQGSGLDQFNKSAGIELVGNALYIADEGNHRVLKWEIGQAAATVVAGNNGQGSLANQLNSPSDVAVGPNGCVYVADRANHRIMKWSTLSNAGIQVAGSIGSGSGLAYLNNPYHVEVDASDAVFVVDQNNHRIVKWCPSALQGKLVAGGVSGSGVNDLKFPTGMDCTSEGLFIADNNNHRIIKWAMTSPQIRYQTQGAGDYQALFYPTNGAPVSSSIKTFTKTSAQANFSSLSQGLQIQFTNSSSAAQQYTWDFGDGSTSNQNNAQFQHIYSNSGSYTVCLTAIDSCGNTDVFCTNVSVSSLKFDATTPSFEFSLYPNPAKDFLRVRSAEDGLLRLIDMQSRVVYEQLISSDSEVEIAVAYLPRGVYILENSTSLGRESKRIVLN
jgi:PKD repeat protein